MIVPDFLRVAGRSAHSASRPTATASSTTSRALSTTEEPPPPRGPAFASATGSTSRRCAASPSTRPLRQQPRPLGRRHLRPARPEATLVDRGRGRPAGARGQARRGAATPLGRGRHRSRAHPDRRRSGRARRGLARLDPPGPDDLGLLRLRDVFQSGADLPVHRLASAMAAGAAGAEMSHRASCRRRATRAFCCSPSGPRSTGPRAAGVSSSAALPALAVVFLAIELASLGSVFGFRTEFAMRATLLVGFAVSAAAIAILIAPAPGTQLRATTSAFAGSSGAASSACRPT